MASEYFPKSDNLDQDSIHSSKMPRVRSPYGARFYDNILNKIGRSNLPCGCLTALFPSHQLKRNKNIFGSGIKWKMMWWWRVWVATMGYFRQSQTIHTLPKKTFVYRLIYWIFGLNWRFCLMIEVGPSLVGGYFESETQHNFIPTQRHKTWKFTFFNIFHAQKQQKRNSER